MRVACVPVLSARVRRIWFRILSRVFGSQQGSSSHELVRSPAWRFMARRRSRQEVRAVTSDDDGAEPDLAFGESVRLRGNGGGGDGRDCNQSSS